MLRISSWGRAIRLEMLQLLSASGMLSIFSSAPSLLTFKDFMSFMVSRTIATSDYQFMKRYVRASTNQKTMPLRF